MTKDNIITWLTINRKKIGYTLGALNIISGLSLLTTETLNGILWLFVGLVIVFDSWSMP